jgi:hypothetical protein
MSQDNSKRHTRADSSSRWPGVLCFGRSNRDWHPCEELFEQVVDISRKIAELNCESTPRLDTHNTSGEPEFYSSELCVNRDVGTCRNRAGVAMKHPPALMSVICIVPLAVTPSTRHGSDTV